MEKIVFSYEASIRLMSKDDILRVWLRSGSQMSDNLTLPTCQFGGGFLLILGEIWIGGRSPLKIMKKTMNSERYIEVLEELVSSISFEFGDLQLIRLT